MPESKKSILVVDDAADFCMLIKEKFEPLGYRVLTASDGREGFKKVVEEKPDIVLLDIRLPKDEDGLECLRQLRSYIDNDPEKQARMRGTPVIILTGSGPSMKTLFESVGISGYFEKPFDLNALHRAVQRALTPR